MKPVRVLLLPNWVDCSEDYAGGHGTFCRQGNDATGALQVSLQAEYKSGPEPNPTGDDLIDFARDLGERHRFGKVVETRAGVCALGTFGSAVFQSAENPLTQVWYLSDGRDFVLVTFVCVAPPTPEEVAEAREMVSRITLTKHRPGRRV
jgi:hypothetical protein